MKTAVNTRFEEIITRLLDRPEVGTMKELAKILGIKSQSSLTGMISGAQQPTIEVLQALYKKFKTDVAYIITGQRAWLKPTPPLEDDPNDLAGNDPIIDPDKLVDEYYRRKEELKKEVKEEVIDEIIKKLKK